jgi:hypothetical protein
VYDVDVVLVEVVGDVITVDKVPGVEGVAIDGIVVVVAQFVFVKAQRLSVQLKYEQLPSGRVGQSESEMQQFSIGVYTHPVCGR